MIVEDQQPIVDFLMRPATHGGATVERIDTHSAVVFLAGERALKLKRAVRYDYLDFSTADRRRACCEAEVRLNRRTAPAIYRGVLPVTRDASGAFALGGDGAPVDWLVDMVRFDQAGLFDRLAARDALDMALMAPLAGAIAALHRDAARRPGHGGRDGMAWVIDGNASGCAAEGAGVLEPERVAAVSAAARRQLDLHGARLDQRRHDGFVRQCHGDLHLRNIVLLDGRPTLFDAIEFNDDIACIDVLYDTAFLVMDLWRRRLTGHANAVLNAYLSDTVDLPGLALLPLFLSCRAAVRAKTSATAARLQTDVARARDLRQLAREYLDMAGDLLEAPPPRLIAIGGRSGTGKSTLARALAPGIGAVPGALILRSDEVRKALAGVSPLTPLDAAAYTPEATARVYRTMTERAAATLAAGHAVVADAVFGEPWQRDEIERIAADASVPFTGLWLDAPADVLTGRVARRAPDASDADARVVVRQLARDFGAVRWTRLDASPDAATVLAQARAACG